MKKVLLLYYEPQRSGQTTHVLSLARGLDRSRWRVTVILPKHLVGAAAELAECGVEVLPIPMRKLVWNPRTILSLLRFFRREGFDLVHIHSQEAGLWARAVAWLAGTPALIYTPQTTDIRRTRYSWLYVLIERVLSRVTKVIVSVSELDRERLIRWGIPPQKVETIPNGIDLGKFKGAVDVKSLRTLMGLESNRPVVMQVGRLSEQKDPMAFVCGASRVIRTCPAAQFVLMGDGPLLDAVSARVRELDMEEMVHLLGWRDNAFRLVAAADIVTLTSRWEGAPYALLEAMAWSRPVVSTAVNGCSEIVADGISGFLVPHGDTETWARRVVEVLGDPALAISMGHQGRERVETEFSLSKMLSRVEHLYSAV